MRIDGAEYLLNVFSFLKIGLHNMFILLDSRLRGNDR